MSEVLSSEFQVSTAESGSSAFGLIANGDPDIILLDVHMPGFKGDGIARILKGHEGRAPVVLFSAMDRERLRKLAADCGADGFIAKTFEFSALKAQVRRHLKANSSA